MSVNVKVTEREVERVVKETVTEKTVVLELSEEAAVALAALTGSVGGASHKKSVRTETDHVYRALADTGYGFGHAEYLTYRDSITTGPSVQTDRF